MKETERIEQAKMAARARRMRRVAIDGSLQDVAALVGKHSSQIHRWERGKALPKKEDIQGWERALSILETSESKKNEVSRGDFSAVECFKADGQRRDRGGGTQDVEGDGQ